MTLWKDTFSHESAACWDGWSRFLRRIYAALTLQKCIATAPWPYQFSPVFGWKHLKFTQISYIKQPFFLYLLPHFWPKQHKSIYSRPKHRQIFIQTNNFLPAPLYCYVFQIFLLNCIYRPGLSATGKNCEKTLFFSKCSFSWKQSTSMK